MGFLGASQLLLHIGATREESVDLRLMKLGKERKTSTCDLIGCACTRKESKFKELLCVPHVSRKRVQE
jgi:hypothetical protein